MFKSKKKVRPWELSEEERKKEKDIVVPYIKKLYAQLKEKNAFSFWIVAGHSLSKRFAEGQHIFNFESLIKKHKHLWGKTLVKIIIKPLANKRSKIQKDHNIWLVVSMQAWPIDKNGNIDEEGTNVYNFHWGVKDFMLSRFTFKLLEPIAKAVGDKRLGGAIFEGVSFDHVVLVLKKKGIDLSKHFNPLGGM